MTDPNTLTAQGEKFKNAFMYLSGGPRPTFEEEWFYYLDLLFDRGSGEGDWSGILDGVSVNTEGVVYQLDTDSSSSGEEILFNASVFRADGDFDARNPPRSDGVRAMPVLEGRIGVPVLSVHTLESRVPFAVQQSYRSRVFANANEDNLVQRIIRSAFHCDFLAEEWTESFDALASWEQDGIAPEGDLVPFFGPVADPDDYGCTFTRGIREGIPACP